MIASLSDVAAIAKTYVEQTKENSRLSEIVIEDFKTGSWEYKVGMIMLFVTIVMMIVVLALVFINAFGLWEIAFLQAPSAILLLISTCLSAIFAKRGESKQEKKVRRENRKKKDFQILSNLLIAEGITDWNIVAFESLCKQIVTNSEKVRDNHKAIMNGMISSCLGGSVASVLMSWMFNSQEAAPHDALMIVPVAFVVVFAACYVISYVFGHLLDEAKRPPAEALLRDIQLSRIAGCLKHESN